MKQSAAARAAWLEARRSGIGGSDAPVVLGLSKWRSPFELWAEKTGQYEPPDRSQESEFVEWGQRLEDVIAEAYTDKTGRRVQRSKKQLEHPTHTFMRANVDRFVWHPEFGKGVLQIKTTDRFFLGRWIDEGRLGDELAPYQAQLQHELFVSGCEWGTFVVLVGGNRLLFDVEHPHLIQRRHEQFIQRVLLPTETEFWKLVVERRPPAMGPSHWRADERALKSMYDCEDPELPPAMLDASHRTAFGDLEALKQQAKQLEAEIKSRQNLIYQTLGDADSGIWPEGDGYAWRSVTVPEHPVKESTFRRLTYKKRPKEIRP